MDAARRLDEGESVVVVLFHAGRDRENVGIEDDILRREADVLREDAVRALADRDLPVRVRRLAFFVEGHDDDGGSVPPDSAGLLLEDLFALLEADRVHDAFSLKALQPGLDDTEPGAVDHDGKSCDVGLRGDEVQKPRHLLFGVEQALVHVDVEDVGATFDLMEGDVERFLERPGRDEASELARAGHVGPLADDDEIRVRADRERLQSRELRERRALRALVRCMWRDGLGDRPDVLRGRAATATREIEPAFRSELCHRLGHLLGRLVVPAERVRKPGVRKASDEDVRGRLELLDVGAHARRAERAVDADAEKGSVRHGDPERLGRLPRKVPAAVVDDRHRSDHGKQYAALIEELLNGGESRFHVQRIEARLREQDVRAAVDETTSLLQIGELQLIERDGAVCRVRYVR